MTIDTKKRSVRHLGYKIDFTNNCGSGYECKTCKKRFDTFQALGGHQGTHKKVKFSDTNDAGLLNLDDINVVPKFHQCKTCMKEFETGQALGGHMRRHRIKKTLILIEKEGLHKAESDLLLAAVEELQWVKAEQDKLHQVKTDLVLAAKEWRLSV